MSSPSPDDAAPPGASDPGARVRTPSRQSAAAARRRAREQQILAETRRLFAESGVRDGKIDDIAKAVGINRAILCRHFSGKEELFALALESYLEELRGRLEPPAAEHPKSPVARL